MVFSLFVATFCNDVLSNSYDFSYVGGERLTNLICLVVFEWHATILCWFQSSLDACN